MSAAAVDRRVQIALAAGIHIDALVKAMRRAPHDDELADAVTVRIEQLACAIQSALGDVAHGVPDLELQVLGFITEPDQS